MVNTTSAVQQSNVSIHHVQEDSINITEEIKNIVKEEEKVRTPKAGNNAYKGIPKEWSPPLPPAKPDKVVPPVIQPLP